MALVVSRLPGDGGLVELFSKAAAGALVYGVVALLLDAGGARGRALEVLGAVRGRIAASERPA
jgi:hypothetical protein